jgi:hypothetical protein
VHTNHHAAGDRNTTKAYTLEKVHVTLALRDVNNDGSVGIDDLMSGDRVKLIGKLTSLAKKCSRSGFSPTTTIHRIIVHPPSS